MALSPHCRRMGELGPEVALAVADGEDRAWAFEHLAGCAECRSRLERLAAVADELLLIAPAAEPPGGFEDRATEAMTGLESGRSLRRAGTAGGGRRRLLAPAIAAAGAAACTAAAVWFGLAGDRDLADSYRETLAVANGEYFDAAPLTLADGERAGYVYGYQGRTSWVLAVVYDGVADGVYELEAVSADGERSAVTTLEVDGDRGSAGAALDVEYDEVAEIRLLDGAGREVAGSAAGSTAED